MAIYRNYPVHIKPSCIRISFFFFCRNSQICVLIIIILKLVVCVCGCANSSLDFFTEDAYVRIPCQVHFQKQISQIMVGSFLIPAYSFFSYQFHFKSCYLFNYPLSKKKVNMVTSLILTSCAPVLKSTVHIEMQ